MSEPVAGTRDQTPEDLRQLPSAPRPVFAAGEPVPGLSSWVLERKLGGGGFGEVWLARHVWNAKEKPRAVKFCLDPAARNRLVTHERNVVVRVMKYAGEHPNIVPLLDCNLDGDIPWLMYEFVEGGTLAGLIKEWRELPLPKRLGRAVRVLHALAGALATCHRFDPPLVHRDMKPHNVMMAGAVPRITDFGIGSVVLEPNDGDATGALTAYAAHVPTGLQGAGTRLYAPAEQTLGSTPNPRDDVYALGVIAYQLVTADLTTGPGADATLELRDLKIPGELVSLIIRSAALDPNRRPKDATEWETVLAGLIDRARKQKDTSVTGSRAVLLPEPGEPTAGLPVRTGPSLLPPTPPDLAPEPRPVRADRRQPEPAKRGLVAILIGSVLALGLVVGVAMSLLPSGKQSEPTKSAEQPKSGPPDPKKGAAPDPGPVPARIPKLGETRDLEIANGVKMTFCWVPAGECQLGSPKSERDTLMAELKETEEPDWLRAEAAEQRGTWKTGGFWMGKYEVTQAEWTAVMGTNPSEFDGKKDNKAKGLDTSRFPVERVSWDMICGTGGGFLEKINAHGGLQTALGRTATFRLPSMDEWEYACRGGLGNMRPFHFGDNLNGTEANINGNFPFGTTVKGDLLGRTCVVDDTNKGKYMRHPWGLMHMHGNVWEWCEDLQVSTASRYIRGGSWYDYAYLSRSAALSILTPDTQLGRVGFRVVVAGLP